MRLQHGDCAPLKRDQPLLKCTMCGRSFNSEAYLKRHIQAGTCVTSFGERKHVCPHCGARFSQKHNLKQHVKGSHSEERIGRVFRCEFCKKVCRSPEELLAHRRRHQESDRANLLGGRAPASVAAGGFVVLRSAHRQRCLIRRLTFPPDVGFLVDALVYARPRIKTMLRNHMLMHKYFKVGLVIYVELVKIGVDGEIETTVVAPFRSKTHTVNQFTDLDEIVDDSFATFDSTLDEFTSSGSGFSVNQVLYLESEMVKLQPLTGSGACGAHEVVSRRKAGYVFADDGFERSCQNERTHSKDCFFLAIASYFLPGARESELQEFISSSLRVEVALPVSIGDIPKVEAALWSEMRLSINVLFKDEENNVYPAYVSSRTSAEHVVPLMLCLTERQREGAAVSDAEAVDHHYALIRDLPKMLAPRRRDVRGMIKWTAKGRLCFNCLNYVHRESTFKRHVAWCHSETGQHVIMPQPGEVIKYENRSLKSTVAFTAYFDFETCQLAPEHACRCREGDVMCGHRTKTVTEMKPVSYTLVLVSREGRVLEEIVYVGEDAGEHFLNTALDIEQHYLDFIDAGGCSMEKLTAKEKRRLERAVNCVICHEELGGENRVIHHSHSDGRVLGVAHASCNLEVSFTSCRVF